MKLFKFLLLLLFSLKLQSQQINMNFPKFAGKSYDFIIFQGTKQKTLIQGVIRDDGKFILNIPKEFAPYEGMSRWLITGTKEGGGLDMYIPGHDFSVSCLDSEPNDKNIVYVNNSGNTELNSIYKQQGEILSRYQAMLLATKSYDVSSSYYSLFKSELDKQKQEYMVFQEALKNRENYISRLLLILNITRGMGGVLTDSEYQNGKDISGYISRNLDWNSLYTSGHWSEVIEGFVNIHALVLKDSLGVSEDFKMISDRISSPEIYTDFCERLTYYLKQLGKDEYIAKIAPIIISSGKLTNYDGTLSEYFNKNVSK
ncbi:alkyl hydroperoxide reductase [Elizabethkingia anophelis]|nr:alkyl hydroperoxide reductase [Elizabethkingia anophelis]MDV3861082.1 alkyl hydroperoxide reductase [Elizabethkingia anophelis]MDV3909505.1 alkyl hydroperoxide reductase [Elizabethkingia anophelis]MDV3924295.1 alkyl hydroperoxide reductase [Elizabethkingia anophelis]MDV3989342.1 alkyl hydroperoxide reductase [Elizabethkingia anophelis]